MSFEKVFISCFGKKGKDGFRNGFLLYDIIKKRNYFKYHYFKKGVFKPYSSIYYLTQWGLISLNYFF